MTRKTNLAVALLACLVFSGASIASIIDSEPNDSLGTASVISNPGGLFADAGVGLLDGSADYYSIDLLAGDFLTVNTAGIEDPSTLGLDPDTILALADSAGTIIEFDDDDGQSRGSNFTFSIPADDTYYIAVSSWSSTETGSVGDTLGVDNFNGTGESTGNYIMTLSVVPVPEPSSFALLGGLALAIFGIRRR